MQLAKSLPTLNSMAKSTQAGLPQPMLLKQAQEPICTQLIKRFTHEQWVNRKRMLSQEQQTKRVFMNKGKLLNNGIPVSTSGLVKTVGLVFSPVALPAVDLFALVGI